MRCSLSFHVSRLCLFEAARFIQISQPAIGQMVCVQACGTTSSHHCGGILFCRLLLCLLRVFLFIIHRTNSQHTSSHHISSYHISSHDIDSHHNCESPHRFASHQLRKPAARLGELVFFGQSELRGSPDLCSSFASFHSLCSKPPAATFRVVGNYTFRIF